MICIKFLQNNNLDERVGEYMSKLFEAFQSIIPIFILLSFLIVFITLSINRRAGRRLDTLDKQVHYLIFIGLMLSIIGTLLLTLLPSSNPEKVTQLVPFYSILDTFEYAADYAIINSIGMNILLFVPFGFFLFLMIRQEIITVLFAFLFSATIEFLQYALPIGRISNVDDVILNTLGGIIGMLVGVIVLKFGIVYNRVRKGR